jgi:hypothetical protein
MKPVTKTLAWFAGTAAVCVGVPAPAWADSAVPGVTVALDYGAPARCPDLAGFQTLVIGRLGYDPFRAQGPERVIVTIASGPRGLEGRMEWRDAGGSWAGDRTFPARTDDCGELARAMGFALALQIQFYAASATLAAGAAPTSPIDAPAASATVQSAPASARTSTPDAIATSQAPPQAPPAPPRARPVLVCGAGAWVGGGSSAEPVPFGRVFGGLAWPRLAAELALELGWPATVRRADGAGFSQQEILGSLAGCTTGRRWSGCLLAKAGQIRIRGKDIDQPAAASGLLLKMGARLGVRQAVGKRVYLAGYFEGLALLTRWRVSLDGDGVWASPRFGAAAGLDLGVLLP